MFARIGTYDVPEGKGEAVKDAFRQALGAIRELPGYESAMLLHSVDDKRAVTITFWEDASALSGSRVAATRLRSDAARAVEGDVVMVDEFEVVPLD